MRSEKLDKTYDLSAHISTDLIKKANSLLEKNAKHKQGFWSKYGQALAVLATMLTIILNPVFSELVYGRNLSYKIVGPIFIDNKIVVQITLHNSSNQREKDIEVFLPRELPSAIKIEANEDFEASRKTKQTVLKFDGLNGEAAIQIKILVNEALEIEPKEWESLNISTDNTTARLESEEIKDQLHFIMFVIIFWLFFNLLIELNSLRKEKQSISELKLAAKNLEEFESDIEKASKFLADSQERMEKIDIISAQIDSAREETILLHKETKLLHEELLSKKAICTHLANEIKEILESLRWSYTNLKNDDQIKKCILRIDSGLRERLSELQKTSESTIEDDCLHPTLS